MVKRRLAVLMAVVAATIGLHAPFAGAVTVPVTVCVVSGTVSFSAPVTGGVTGPVLGSSFYTFDSVLFACAGGLSGFCSASSSGNSFAVGLNGRFSGSLGVGSCIPTGQSCSGSVGGPMLLPGVVPPLPGPFSFTAGPLVLGSLNTVNCAPMPVTAGITVGGHTNGSGVMALVAAPNPTSVPGCFGLAGVTLQYCGVLVAGAAVIVS